MEGLLAPALEEAGYRLSSLKMRGKPAALEITVDRDEPISLDDIVEVSTMIDGLLDPLDPFDGPYVLDVSSLGAEKPIPVEHLERALGKKCSLHLSTPYRGANEIEGLLVELDGEKAVLLTSERGRKRKIELMVEAIDRARLAI